MMYLLAWLYMAVLWVPVFIHTPMMRSQSEGYLFRVVEGWLPASQSWTLLVAMILIWVQGLVLTHMALHHRLGVQATLFPGLMLVWFYSMVPESMDFLPVTLANTFLVFAWRELFSLYRNPQAAMNLFNAGFLIGMAGLSYFPVVVFAVVGLVCMHVLRGINLKETLQYLIGAGMPWFFLFIFYEYVGPEIGYAELAGIHTSWPLRFAGYLGTRIPIQLTMILLLVLYLLSITNRLIQGETMQVQKYIAIAWWFMLGGAITLLLAGTITVDQLQVVALPLGLIMGLWLARLPEKWAESIHFVLFAAVFIYQYFPLVYL